MIIFIGDLQHAQQNFFKIQPRGMDIPVKLFQVFNNGIWKNCTLGADGFYVGGVDITYPLVFPIQVRIISFDGQTITNTIITLVNDQDIPGTGQYNPPKNTTDPTNPTNPTNPTDPTNPSNPTNPVETNPGQNGTNPNPAQNGTTSSRMRSSSMKNSFSFFLLFLVKILLF